VIEGRPRHPRAEEASALAAEAEGYLLARSHQDDARREARQLCADLPWLTSAQAEEVARHYYERRMALTRQMLGATVRRAGELRQEYEERYQQLRREVLRRHAVCASALLACATGAGAAVGALAR
jgi:hypothetical protein